MFGLNARQQWRFFKRFRGRTRRLLLPSFLEETRVFDKCWEFLSITLVFHKKKCIRPFRLKQKMIVLLKDRVFSFWSTAFAENLPT